jgi:hypothetical protein
LSPNYSANLKHLDAVQRQLLERRRLRLSFEPPLLKTLGARAASMAFVPGDAASLAHQIEALLNLPSADYAAMGHELRAIVEREHEVGALMQRLVQHMSALP